MTALIRTETPAETMTREQACDAEFRNGQRAPGPLDESVEPLDGGDTCPLCGGKIRASRCRECGVLTGTGAP